MMLCQKASRGNPLQRANAERELKALRRKDVTAEDWQAQKDFYDGKFKLKQGEKDSPVRRDGERMRYAVRLYEAYRRRLGWDRSGSRKRAVELTVARMIREGWSIMVKQLQEHLRRGRPKKR